MAGGRIGYRSLTAFVNLTLAKTEYDRIDEVRKSFRWEMREPQIFFNRHSAPPCFLMLSVTFI
jgi:hypothetical protein